MLLLQNLLPYIDTVQHYIYIYTTQVIAGLNTTEANSGYKLDSQVQERLVVLYVNFGCLLILTH